jgi:membrane-associated phospholipid phosphatase
MKRRLQVWALLGGFAGTVPSTLWAQELPSAPSEAEGKTVSHRLPVGRRDTHPYELQPGEDPENRLVSPFAKHVVTDQKNFWTAPLRWKAEDLRWILPLAAATGGVVAADSWISQQVPSSPSQLNRSKQISDYGAYSLIGATGGAFLLGHLTHNEHLRETGFLAGEAAFNSTLASYAFKMVTRRPRPFEGNGNGTFFQGGASFPSEHSAVAWSVAGVIAHEYPGPITKVAAYGLASAITMTRVTSKQHFASDVIVGSLLGWYFGHEVYRAHHDPELGGSAWGNFLEKDRENQPRDPKNVGSPAVPPDSWVYPLFERLAALGYIRSAYLGMRPWTRMECARLLDEAGERIRYDGVGDGDAEKIYFALLDEFRDDVEHMNGAANVGITLDSVYTRGTQISGTPLRDGYHFGQTIINDYGRPYASGFNAVTGVSGRAVAGPLSFYVRGEYQHAPAAPSYSADVLSAIAAADQTLPLPNGTPEINRFALLDASIAVTFRNVQLSFGRQSHWLGSDESGPFLSSDNAQPITQFDIQSVSPFHFPLLSRVLGPARMEFFLGQLSGQTWDFNPPNLLGPGFTPQPFVHGDKITFKPTPNLEIGMGITAMFGGPGLPFTFSEFFKTYFSHKATIADNPAKRFSSVDFNYRVPGLRDWLIVYANTMVGDEISPIGASRALVNPGIYLPKIPGIKKLDLRAEITREPLTREFPPGFVYYDRRYRSGFTNEGNLIGSWVGRAGAGGRLWATYWLSPRTNFQLGYREQHVSRRFLEGGRLHDVSARGEFLLNPQTAVEASVQYERWNFPLLAAGQQSNVSASLQLTFSPHWGLRK